MTNRKFDYREKIRDFVLEEWPGIAAIILFIAFLISFLPSLLK